MASGMMQRIGELGIKSPSLRAKVKVIGSLVLLVIAGFLIVRSFSGSNIGEASRKRIAVDSETGEVIEIKIVDGDRFPWKNPKTGQLTLYPGEPCYWTKDGKAKLIPTYVFVKAYAGIKEKTICPDCGKEVRQHNPLPPDKLMEEAATNKGG